MPRVPRPSAPVVPPDFVVLYTDPILGYEHRLSYWAAPPPDHRRLVVEEWTPDAHGVRRWQVSGGQRLIAEVVLAHALLHALTVDSSKATTPVLGADVPMYDIRGVEIPIAPA